MSNGGDRMRTGKKEDREGGEGRWREKEGRRRGKERKSGK